MTQIPEKFEDYVTDEKRLLDELEISLSLSEIYSFLRNSPKQFFQDMRDLDKFLRAYKNNKAIVVNWLIDNDFIFRINEPDNKEDTSYFIFRVWDITGMVNIIQYTVPTDRENPFDLRSVANTLERFKEGFIPCADCGKEIEVEKNKRNMIYGGIYCDTDILNYLYR